MPVEIRNLDNGLGCLIKAEGNLSSEAVFSPIFEHIYKPKEVHEKYIYLISIIQMQSLLIMIYMIFIKSHKSLWNYLR